MALLLEYYSFERQKAEALSNFHLYLAASIAAAWREHVGFVLQPILSSSKAGLPFPLPNQTSLSNLPFLLRMSTSKLLSFCLKQNLWVLCNHQLSAPPLATALPPHPKLQVVQQLYHTQFQRCTDISGLLQPNTVLSGKIPSFKIQDKWKEASVWVMSLIRWSMHGSL